MLRDIMLAEKTWAVIGVSHEHKKFSNRIYRRLKSLGYTVYAVNPGLSEVEGDPCYPDLNSLPQVPQVVIMVIPPRLSPPVLQAAADLGIKYVWFQPGTWNEEIERLGQELNLTMLQECILDATKK